MATKPKLGDEIMVSYLFFVLFATVCHRPWTQNSGVGQYLVQGGGKCIAPSVADPERVSTNAYIGFWRETPPLRTPGYCGVKLRGNRTHLQVSMCVRMVLNIQAAAGTY